MKPHTVQFLRHRRRKRQRLAAMSFAGVMLGWSGVSMVQTAQATPIVTAAGTSVDVYRTNDPYHYGRQFAIVVDGPVTLRIQMANPVSSSGLCRTTYTGTSGPHRSPVPVGAVCTGVGAVTGDTPMYDYIVCDQVTGRQVANNLTVLADGVEVFNDSDRGPCPPPTTTTTTTAPPPTTTTTSPPRPPGTRYCVQRNAKGGGCRSYNCPPQPGNPNLCYDPSTTTTTVATTTTVVIEPPSTSSTTVDDDPTTTTIPSSGYQCPADQTTFDYLRAYVDQLISQGIELSPPLVDNNDALCALVGAP